MPGDLSTPTHLRALVEALPEHQRQPWEHRVTSVYMNGRSYGSVVAIPHAGPSPITGVHSEIAELVATVASPPVVLALADHLEALAAFHEPAVGQPIAFDEVGQAIRRLLRTRDALEAAIHRTPEGAA